MIFYVLCAAVVVEFLVVLGWSAVFFAAVALAVAIVAFHTRREGWWRLPLSAAALAGALGSIYSLGIAAALLACAVVFGIVAAAWAAGHSPQGRERPPPAY